MDALAGTTTEVDGDDAVRAPFAFACETVYADEVCDGGAHAATFEVDPVERGRGVGIRGGDPVGRRGVVRGGRGAWTGGHGGTWCGGWCEGVWKQGDGGRLLVSGDGRGCWGRLGRIEADVVFGSEERPEEGDEVVVGDLGEGVVVDDGAGVGVAGVDDPGRGHAEAGPYFAVFCAHADCLEGVAETGCVGVSAEGGDEHGLDVARCGHGGGELGEEGEDMCSSAAAGRVYGLCARNGARVWVGVEDEGVGEKDGPGREDAEGRRDEDGQRVPPKTSHHRGAGRTTLHSDAHACLLPSPFFFNTTTIPILNLASFDANLESWNKAKPHKILHSKNNPPTSNER